MQNRPAEMQNAVAPTGRLFRKIENRRKYNAARRKNKAIIAPSHFFGELTDQAGMAEAQGLVLQNKIENRKILKRRAKFHNRRSAASQNVNVTTRTRIKFPKMVLSGRSFNRSRVSRITKVGKRWTETGNTIWLCCSVALMGPHHRLSDRRRRLHNDLKSLGASEEIQIPDPQIGIWYLRRHSAAPAGDPFQERISNTRSGKVQGGNLQYFSLQGFNRKLSIRVRNRLALVSRNGIQNIGCETVPPPKRSQAMAPTVTG
jgi:hypothetical protein